MRTAPSRTPRARLVQAAGLLTLALALAVFTALAGPVVPASAQEQPTITGDLTYENVGGWNFTPNSTVSVVVKATTGGDQVFSDTATTDGEGNFWLQVGVDLQVGMYLSVTDGVALAEHVLEDVQIASIDPVTNVVTGTAPEAGRTVQVAQFDTGWESWMDTTTGSAGVWSVDFDTIGYDVTGTEEIDAVLFAADGDRTSVADRYFDGNLGVRYEGDGIEGHGFRAGSWVTLDVYAAGGTRLLHKRLRADIDGSFELGTASVNLVAGMRITARDEVAAIAKELVLPTLTIDTLDVATDVVAGQAPADTQVSLTLKRAGEPYDHLATADLVSDSTGHWSVDWGDYGQDLVNRWQLWGPLVWDSDGDWTAGWYWEPTARGDLALDTVEGRELAQAGSATVDIYAAGGAQLFSGTVVTDVRGGFSLPRKVHRVNLVPGIRIVVDDGAVTRDLTLVPLAMVGFDPMPGPSYSSGTATPGSQVTATWGWEVLRPPKKSAGYGDGYATTTDESGSWYVDWVAVYGGEGGPPADSTTAGAEIYDADGDATVFTYFTARR